MSDLTDEWHAASAFLQPHERIGATHFLLGWLLNSCDPEQARAGMLAAVQDATRNRGAS